jgi:hypothetical protein
MAAHTFDFCLGQCCAATLLVREGTPPPGTSSSGQRSARRQPARAVKGTCCPGSCSYGSDLGALACGTIPAYYVRASAPRPRRATTPVTCRH